MSIEFAFEFTAQGIWDEIDFESFILEVKDEAYKDGYESHEQFTREFYSSI